MFTRTSGLRAVELRASASAGRRGAPGDAGVAACSRWVRRRSSRPPGRGCVAARVVVRLRDGADPDDVPGARTGARRPRIVRRRGRLPRPATAAEVSSPARGGRQPPLGCGGRSLGGGGSAAVPAVGVSVSARSGARPPPATRGDVALVGAGPWVSSWAARSPCRLAGAPHRVGAEVDPGVGSSRRSSSGPALLARAGGVGFLGPCGRPRGRVPAGRRVSVAPGQWPIRASPGSSRGPLASDRGGGAVPVRSAFVGVTLGVAGVLGAGVVVAASTA